MYYREEQSSAKEAGDLIGGRYEKEDGPAPFLLSLRGWGGTILWPFHFWSRGLKESTIYCT